MKSIHKKKNQIQMKKKKKKKSRFPLDDEINDIIISFVLTFV
jgi:hypothetical protein